MEGGDKEGVKRPQQICILGNTSYAISVLCTLHTSKEYVYYKNEKK